MILVSACLLGIYSRYNGGSNIQPLLAEYTRCGQYLPVCPEQLGGMPTPRPPVEIVGGSGQDVLAGEAKAINEDRADVSAAFIKGAEETLALARAFPVTAAILKERSPSCGVRLIYDGSFCHSVKKGRGVTACLLNQLNIPIYSEDEITRELLLKLIDKDKE